MELRFISVQLARLEFVERNLCELGPHHRGLQVDQVRADPPGVDENLQTQWEQLGQLQALIALR